MFVNLRTYLSTLKDQESTKPQGIQKHVPTLTELAESVGVHQTTLTRIAGNKIRHLDLDTAGKIIDEMRKRGFPMRGRDLVTYRTENEIA